MFSTFRSKLCSFFTKTICRHASTIIEPKPVKLAYTVYGPPEVKNAPPLIIMHGLFGSKSNWNSLCKALQRRASPTRQIIAVDARNHGNSPHSKVHTYEAMAADIKHLVESEKFGERVSLMGHSMGGRAMMLFALKWPEMVERLVVVDISPVSTSKSLPVMESFFEVMQRVELERGMSMSVARQHADAALENTIPDRSVRSFLLTNLIQNMDGSYKWRININALLDNFQQIGTFPTMNVQYKGPTLFISGEASDYILPQDHKPIKQLFPNALFTTIPGAGHWVHSEKPNEFLNAILPELNNQL